MPGWQVPPPQQPPWQIEWLASPHALSHWPVVVLQAVPMGQSPAPVQDGIGLVVVVVVAHGPQSCEHVEQSSEGPHSPSPHAQLQGGDPSVQLQRFALQSAMTFLRQARLARPLRPLAATSSLQAFRPHGGAAFVTEARTPTPSASPANPASTFRAAMDSTSGSGEAARVPPDPLTSVPTRRRGLSQRSLLPARAAVKRR